ALGGLVDDHVPVDVDDAVVADDAEGAGAGGADAEGRAARRGERRVHLAAGDLISPRGGERDDAVVVADREAGVEVGDAGAGLYNGSSGMARGAAQLPERADRASAEVVGRVAADVADDQVQVDRQRT